MREPDFVFVFDLSFFFNYFFSNVLRHCYCPFKFGYVWTRQRVRNFLVYFLVYFFNFGNYFLCLLLLLLLFWVDFGNQYVFVLLRCVICLY